LEIPVIASGVFAAGFEFTGKGLVVRSSITVKGFMGLATIETIDHSKIYRHWHIGQGFSLPISIRAGGNATLALFVNAPDQFLYFAAAVVRAKSSDNIIRRVLYEVVARFDLRLPTGFRSRKSSLDPRLFFIRLSFCGLFWGLADQLLGVDMQVRLRIVFEQLPNIWVKRY
jgi:hypothetical protein